MKFFATLMITSWKLNLTANAKIGRFSEKSSMLYVVQATVEAIRTRYGAVCTTLPHFVAWRQLGKVPSRV
jgi:hypothetical protein